MPQAGQAEVPHQQHHGPIVTRWHAAGRHFMATVLLFNCMHMHPLFFFMVTGCIIAAVFLTGAEMENRNGYR